MHVTGRQQQGQRQQQRQQQEQKNICVLWCRSQITARMKCHNPEPCVRVDGKLCIQVQIYKDAF